MKIRVLGSETELGLEAFSNLLEKRIGEVRKVIPKGNPLHRSLEDMLETGEDLYEATVSALEELQYEDEDIKRMRELMIVLVDYKAGVRDWSEVEECMAEYQASHRHEFFFAP